MSQSKGFSEEKRIPFFHQDQQIYEWSQTLNEILIFIQLPSINGKFVSKNDLQIILQPRRLCVKLRGCEPYINTNFWSTIDVDESTWYIDGQELRIECTKAKKGETWKATFEGHGELNPFAEEEVRKRMMLERFQEEHRQFDFSNAQFTGNAPDPRTFLNGSL